MPTRPLTMRSNRLHADEVERYQLFQQVERASADLSGLECYVSKVLKVGREFDSVLLKDDDLRAIEHRCRAKLINHVLTGPPYLFPIGGVEFLVLSENEDRGRALAHESRQFLRDGPSAMRL